GFITLQLPLDDDPSANLAEHFMQANKFIEDALSTGGKILVHCQAGISRSATIVAAFLIYSRGLTPQDALNQIKKSRPGVRPNDGFLRQLDIF
ncbi:DSPc-domain-containing protein, partial [Exidia glandulosa HHB12029]